MRTPEKQPDGRYKVRFRFGKSPRTGKPLQTSERFATYREAEDFCKWLDALGPQGALDKLYEGEQAARVPRLDEVARDHIDHIDGGGEAHKKKQQRLWDRTWSPRIGFIRADQISRDQLVKALADLAANGKAPGVGYSEKSLYNQRGLLYGVLERCVTEGHLPKHPGKKLRLPQVTRALDADLDEGDEMVCMTPEQFDVLYTHTHAHYRALVRFLVGTGARWGEAVALRVGDVDRDRGTVRIRRAWKWSPDGQHVIGPPKTKKSKRTIALPAEVLGDLRELCAGRAATELVFTAVQGGMVAHRTFWSNYWRPALWSAQHCAEHTDPACRCGKGRVSRCPVHEEAPPPCGCSGTLTITPRIHDLRHTHASWLLAAGVPIHVVQARLGHESIQTTVDTYSDLLPDAQQAAQQAASLAFAGARQLR